MTTWKGGRQLGAQDAAAFGREYGRANAAARSDAGQKKRRQTARRIAVEAIRVWRLRWAAVR